MTFIDFCRLHGILIDELPREGTWRRYKTEDKPQHRNGAVKFMGDHGFVQNHATMTEIATWHAEGGSTPVKPIDAGRLREQRDRDRAQRLYAMRSARAYWNECTPLKRAHPYLERKGLSTLGCSGLRERGGMLVVPVLYGPVLISVQTIKPDGTKRFFTGAPVKAGSYVLERSRAAITAICEGLATGLAIFQSVRNCRVLVAFDAGNMLPVVQRIKPHGSVVLVADNDHKTAARIGTNPGIAKARNAAELIGCGVVWFDGIEGSDAADALKEWGVGADRRIERAIHAGMKYVNG